MAWFRGLSDVHECLGDLWMAQSCLNKDITGQESPHDLLVKFAIDLVTICEVQNDLSWWHLTVLNFWHRTSHYPSFLGYPLTCMGVLVVLTRQENKLPKMAGNSASHPSKSWPTKVTWMAAIRKYWISGLIFLLHLCWIQLFKFVITNTVKEVNSNEYSFAVLTFPVKFSSKDLH